MTIKDIAKEAGVSITTVSRVLNNKPDVSAKTKQKVQKIINELGYNPNSVARGLVLKKTQTIGLIIPDISNPFFPEVAKGIEDRARDLGYSVIFCNTDNDLSREKETVKLLKSKQVDGIILSLSVNNKEVLDDLAQHDLPVVQIDRIIPGTQFSTVTIDNQLSAYDATKYLINLGHKNIAHLAGNLEIKNAQDRLQGFKKAIKESDLNYQQNLVIEGNYSKESGYRQMTALLNQSEKPSAVFVANDLMAIGAYEAIFAAGLEIPGDISIIGHDDIELASVIRPNLTTIKQPKYKLGKSAVEILIAEIEDELENCQDIVLNPKLVMRDSTRRIKANE